VVLGARVTCSRPSDQSYWNFPPLTLTTLLAKKFRVSSAFLRAASILQVTLDRGGCAVSHRLPTTAATVRTHDRSCGIYGGQNVTGEDFLRVLQFPLSILFPSTAPHSFIIPTSKLYGPDIGAINKATNFNCDKGSRSKNTYFFFLSFCLSTYYKRMASLQPLQP
jgi:hypothetical protein